MEKLKQREIFKVGDKSPRTLLQQGHSVILCMYVCVRVCLGVCVCAPLSHLRAAGEQTSGEREKGNRGTKIVRQGNDSGDKGNLG